MDLILLFLSSLSSRSKSAEFSFASVNKNQQGMYSSGSQHMDISREDAQKKTYIYQLMNDTGCRIEELPIAMEYRDKERWRERVMEYRANST